jgi:hypothetical protein
MAVLAVGNLGHDRIAIVNTDNHHVLLPHLNVLGPQYMQQRVL